MHEGKSSHEIRLRLSDGNFVPATLDCESRYWNEGGFSHRMCRILLTSDVCQIEAEDSDYFNALCRIRERLSGGIVPRCYGASRNVFPSGMGRDMGEGLKAYKMRMGEPSEDLVHIFVDGIDVEPVSVSEQRAYWQAWLRSRGIPS